MSGTTIVNSSVLFSERDQSIWGGDRAITVEKRIAIIDAHYETGAWSLDVGAGDVSISSAQFDLDVTAVLAFTAGSMSIDYPVDVVVELPNAASPGKAFWVQTRAVVDGVAPLMLSTSPGFSVRIDVRPMPASKIFISRRTRSTFSASTSIRSRTSISVR